MLLPTKNYPWLSASALIRSGSHMQRIEASGLSTRPATIEQGATAGTRTIFNDYAGTRSPRSQVRVPDGSPHMLNTKDLVGVCVDASSGTALFGVKYEESRPIIELRPSVSERAPSGGL